MHRALALTLVLAPLALTGCLRDPGAMEGGDNVLRIMDIDVAAPVVTSGAVVLKMTVLLDNLGAESGGVEVHGLAFDTTTGLLMATTRTEPGHIPKDRTFAADLELTVPRAHGYRLEARVAEDGRTVQRGQVTLSHVSALAPNVHDVGLRIGDMDFLVRNVTHTADGASRVAIETAVDLTSEVAPEARQGRELRIHLKARDVATGLLADEAWTDLPRVGREETRQVRAVLDVPGARNYEVEALLWDGHVVVGRGTGAVQLLPTFTRRADEQVVVTEPRIEDFVRPGDHLADRRGAAPAPGAAATPGPGAALVVLTGIGAAGLAVLRRPRKVRP